MDSKPSSLLRWLFDPEHGASDSLIPRWIFLRALGLIYFSAFFSLLFQIRGLIGPAGILPAKEYLLAVANTAGHARYWYAPTLVQHKFAPIDGAGLGGADCISTVDAEHLAARDAGDLLGVLPFVCGRSSGIFWISVRRNAVGSGIYFVVLCSVGLAPGIRTIAPADTRELVPFALGVVSDLFRIRRGKNRQRRPAVAALHGDGRILPERSAANMDRVVRTTFSALVSHGVGIRDAGIGVSVDAVPAETVADGLLFHRDAVAGGDHSDGELYVSKLSCADAGIFAAGRPLPDAVSAGGVEGTAAKRAAKGICGGGRWTVRFIGASSARQRANPL